MKNLVSPSLPSAGHESLVRGFRNKLAVLLVSKYALAFITLWCFSWGTLVLVLRAVRGMPRQPLLWGAVGVVAAIILAVVKMRQHLPPRHIIRAALDEQGRCGGLLMTAGETDLGAWEARVPTITLPRVRWHNRRALSLLTASAAFVIVSLFVPINFASGDGRALDVSREVEKLDSQIETLKEEQLIEQSRAEMLEQKLEQLQQEASAEDPAKTWEALDHLADNIEKAAKEAAEQAAQQQGKLDKAEALAEGLQAGANDLDQKTLTEAMQTLTGMMQEAMKENEMLAAQLSTSAKDALKSGNLSEENLKEMAGALSQNKSALQQQLSKLQKSGAGNIDPKSLRGGASSQKRDNSGLSKFLRENAPKMSVREAVGQWCNGEGEGDGDKAGNRPGRGGVSRGRGDAAMTWTDGSDENGAKFKETVLPPSVVAGLDDSQLQGLSTGTPQATGNNVAAHGALNNATAGGGSAYTQSVLPRHRGAVKRYFDRK